MQHRHNGRALDTFREIVGSIPASHLVLELHKTDPLNGTRKVHRHLLFISTILAVSLFKIVCICGMWDEAGNTKGGSITVPLTSCLTGLE